MPEMLVNSSELHRRGGKRDLPPIAHLPITHTWVFTAVALITFSFSSSSSLPPLFSLENAGKGMHLYCQVDRSSIIYLSHHLSLSFVLFTGRLLRCHSISSGWRGTPSREIERDSNSLPHYYSISTPSFRCPHSVSIWSSPRRNSWLEIH